MQFYLHCIAVNLFASAAYELIVNSVSITLTCSSRYGNIRSLFSFGFAAARMCRLEKQCLSGNKSTCWLFIFQRSL